MNKILLCIVATLFICSSLLLSCTKSEDVESEKGAIDRMTEKTGNEMADSISGPLEKARNAKDLVNEQYREMDENLKNQ